MKSYSRVILRASVAPRAGDPSCGRGLAIVSKDGERILERLELARQLLGLVLELLVLLLGLREGGTQALELTTWLSVLLPEQLVPLTQLLHLPKELGELALPNYDLLRTVTGREKCTRVPRGHVGLGGSAKVTLDLDVWARRQSYAASSGVVTRRATPMNCHVQPGRQKAHRQEGLVPSQKADP